MAAASRAPPGGGVQTQMRNPALTGPSVTTQAPRQAVLHLRGATMVGEDQATAAGRRIRWAEDVVDNEGMGKKKSKVCCIYHAPKGIDESSDESSSDSSSDSDSGDDGSARPARNAAHSHGHGHNHDHDHGNGNKKVKAKGRARSPNAYEKMPKPKGAPKEKD